MPEQSIESSGVKKVLVGSWNAVKPESQGKAIMRVIDRYFKPEFKTEEDRKLAEKIAGWGAIASEIIAGTAVILGFRSLKHGVKFEHENLSPQDRAIRDLLSAVDSQKDGLWQWTHDTKRSFKMSECIKQHSYSDVARVFLTYWVTYRLTDQLITVVNGKKSKWEQIAALHKSQPVMDSDADGYMRHLKQTIGSQISDGPRVFGDQTSELLLFDYALAQFLRHKEYPGVTHMGVQWKNK